MNATSWLRAPALRRAGSVFWTTLVIGAILAFMLRDPTAVSESFRSMGALNVAWAFALLFAGKILLGEVFGAVARRAGVNHSFWERQRTHHLSQPAKYLPGFVWQFASKGMMLTSRGATSQQAMRIIATEQVWIILGALSTGGLLLVAAGLLDWTATRERLTIPVGPAAVSLVLVVVVVVGAATIMARSDSARAQIIVPRIHETGALLIAWLALAASFAALGLSLNPGGQYWTGFMLAGAFPLAWLGGYLAPFAPGGIGVREGTLVILVAPQVGFAKAASMALISRFVAICVELGLAAALLSPRPPTGITRGRRLRTLN